MKIEFETYWHGGHEAPERAQQLANAAAEAVHTLNYATMIHGDSMVYPSHAGNLLSGLRSMVGHVPQCLSQMQDFADRLADEPRLYDDEDRDPRTTTQLARRNLQHAIELAEDLTIALGTAYSMFNHLGFRDPAAEGEVPVSELPARDPRADSIAATRAGLRAAARARRATFPTDDPAPVPPRVRLDEPAPLTSALQQWGEQAAEAFPAALCSCTHGVNDQGEPHRFPAENCARHGGSDNA